LAHAYLSFGIPDILVGNMISDFVKGKKQLDYPEKIRRGITLHRAIDHFTDTHDVTRQAKVFFKPVYGLYAGPLTDVVYDHFLANDREIFPAPEPGGMDKLTFFAREIYRTLGDCETVLPERFAKMFQYMRSQDWLTQYRYEEGICNSFGGLARRAAYMPDPEPACRLFQTHYKELEGCYRNFFPSLANFALITLEQLQGNPFYGKIE
jgi:acyl carrier protein phosphodiesterase